MHSSFLAFNSGEVTPYLVHRTDVDRHASGLAGLENFVPLPYGGVRKRPGTRWLNTGSIVAGKEAGKVNAQAFQASDGSRYVVVFALDAAGRSRVHVFRQQDGSQAAVVTAITRYDYQGQVVTPAAWSSSVAGYKRHDVVERSGVVWRCVAEHVPVTGTNAPGTGSGWQTCWRYDLSIPAPLELQMIQVNDVAFVVAAGVEPLRLTRASDTVWTLEPVPFSMPPLLTENTEEKRTLKTSFTDGTATPPAWADSPGFVTYQVGDRVSVGTDLYVCVVPHLAYAASNKPGTGAAWQTYWKRDFLDHSSVVGQAVTLVANWNYFTEDHVGAVLRISKKREVSGFEVSLEASHANDGKSSIPLVVQGKWSVITYGTWYGKWVVERSKDRGATWTAVRSFSSGGDRNVSQAGEEDSRVLLRLTWDEETNSYTNKPKAVLSSEEPFIRGLVRVTKVTDGMHAVAETVTPVETCETEVWSEGAFSPRQGYPVAVAVHERRLVYGGTTREPMSLWMSKTDDLLDFETGTVADDGIQVTLAANRQDDIRWLASQRRLFVGTSGGEWVFGSETTDNPISPGTLLVREYSRYGSGKLPPLTAGNSVLFMERQRRRLRELAYVMESQSYEAADLTRLAEHITDTGVLQMAWQQSREPTLWAVLGNGQMVSFTYNRAEKVAAWARHLTVGQFLSVCVLRSEGGDDEVFTVVLRYNELHLEKLVAGQQAVQEAGNVTQAWHVDCGVLYNNSANPLNRTIDLSGYPQFSTGPTLSVNAGGLTYRLEMTGGHVTLPDDGKSRPWLVIGFWLTSALTTLPLDVQAEAGTTHGRMKRAHRLRLDVYQSAGGTLGYVPAENVPEAQPVVYPGAGPLFSGWLEAALWPGHSRDVAFQVVHEEPVPFTLRSAVVDWEVCEA
ncbi:hypothetical protein [Luteolibacter sp. LG18]|uniref:hypothetical protein n=1 Tax=Luteolibacter sp. LG18 TaxID=2819286 RepID=UPI002B2FDFDC|nr:hypothetical protein llg_26720 [Luteolibacter sp. LG18]